MFFTFVDILRESDSDEYEYLLKELAKVELLAKREVLVELYNALMESKEDKISREELIKTIADEIRDIEDLMDLLTHNPTFNMRIAKKEPRITGKLKLR